MLIMNPDKGQRLEVKFLGSTWRIEWGRYAAVKDGGVNSYIIYHDDYVIDYGFTVFVNAKIRLNKYLNLLKEHTLSELNNTLTEEIKNGVPLTEDELLTAKYLRKS